MVESSLCADSMQSFFIAEPVQPLAGAVGDGLSAAKLLSDALLYIYVERRLAWSFLKEIARDVPREIIVEFFCIAPIDCNEF